MSNREQEPGDKIVVHHASPTGSHESVSFREFNGGGRHDYYPQTDQEECGLLHQDVYQAHLTLFADGSSHPTLKEIKYAVEQIRKASPEDKKLGYAHFVWSVFRHE